LECEQEGLPSVNRKGTARGNAGGSGERRATSGEQGVGSGEWEY